jgi:hypothetical protein
MEATALLLTIVLSAVAAGVASYSLNYSRDRLHFRRLKAEELYSAVEKLDHELNRFFGRSYSLCTNTISRFADSDDLPPNSLFASVHMLTRFYFPTLSANLMRVFAAAETASERLARCRSANEVDLEEGLLLLDGAVSELRLGFRDFKGAIVAQQVKARGLVSLLGLRAAYG